MRVLALISCVLLAFAASRSEGAEDDSISVVRTALKLRATGQKIVLSHIQKYIPRLGDRVSIALLKILNEQDLEDPQTVRRFLPIIREAFDSPHFISIQEDREPKVTLFLLKHLEANLPELKQDILQTMGFIQEKTARQGVGPPC